MGGAGVKSSGVVFFVSLHYIRIQRVFLGHPKEVNDGETQSTS